MPEMSAIDLAKALIVTAEVMGHELSPIAAKDMALELSSYPERAVVEGLRRCKRELSGRLTLAAVLQRIDDGRPGVEQAWALCWGARDEGATLVWTDEMSAAWGEARKLGDDNVAARMAFKEAYAALVTNARTNGEPVKWSVSPGHDKSRYAGALLEAVEAGRLPLEYARAQIHPGLPDFDTAYARLERIAGNRPALPDRSAQSAIAALTNGIGRRIP